MKQKLDISALYHCASMNKNYINSFRMSIKLKEKIDPTLLQTVVDDLIIKYPTICSKITNDFFNYYTEKLNHLKIKKSNDLFSTIHLKSIYNQAIEIFYSNKTISIEVFHGISDGHGLFTYFHDLITQYISLKHQLSDSIIDAESKEINQVDSFLTTPTKKFKKSKKDKIFKPFQFEKKIKTIKDQATTFIVDSNEIKEITKKYSCTINEFLLSIFYKSILENKLGNKNVYLSVPINLRRKFDSSTLKNFTLIANIGIKNKENHSIENIIHEIKKQMNRQNSIEYLGHEISKIKKLNLISKYVPISIKNYFIRLLSKYVGNKGCMTISNLGLIKFKDKQVHSYIESMDVVLCSRENTPYNCGVVTVNNKMHINITHNPMNHYLIQKLKEELSNMNIQFNVQDYQESLT